MKTMKTFLIAIFTVLTTLSFSQTNHKFEFTHGGTTLDSTLNTVDGDSIIIINKIVGTKKFDYKLGNGDEWKDITVAFNKVIVYLYVNDGIYVNDENDEIPFENGEIPFVVYLGENDSIKLLIKYTNSNLSIKENTQTVFSLYPNPTTDFLNIKGDNVETVKVFNTSGQMVLSDKGSNFEDTKLDVTSLKNGVYMVMVNDGKPVRFIKR